MNVRRKGGAKRYCFDCSVKTAEVENLKHENSTLSKENENLKAENEHLMRMQYNFKNVSTNPKQFSKVTGLALDKSMLLYDLGSGHF